ncbi:hypothetical protein NPIL_368361 [Nephila pilipes]|uniref:Uncharacterized protein n=1 Tax=Nephila pilipes TaxID=299642 RepID=A0A8X6U884_NEPPI|nr:hypothetical protein NPIL_368361 [Nephila pilipes]
MQRICTIILSVGGNHSIASGKSLEDLEAHCKWVLPEESKLQRFTICSSSLLRHKKARYLNQILIHVEKCVLCSKSKRTHWSFPGSVACVPKQNVHQQKLQLCIWWTSAGIAHFEFLQNSKKNPGRGVPVAKGCSCTASEAASAIQQERSDNSSRQHQFSYGESGHRGDQYTLLESFTSSFLIPEHREIRLPPAPGLR